MICLHEYVLAHRRCAEPVTAIASPEMMRKAPRIPKAGPTFVSSTTGPDDTALEAAEMAPAVVLAAAIVVETAAGILVEAVPRPKVEVMIWTVTKRVAVACSPVVVAVG